jgi:hypothetical protein
MYRSNSQLPSAVQYKDKEVMKKQKTTAKL